MIIHQDQILIEQQYLMMWPLVFCCCGFQVENKNRYYCNNPSYETKKTKATKIKQSRTSFSRHFLTLCSEAISSIKTKVLRRKLFCASFSKRISESNRHSHETILYIRLRIFIQDLETKMSRKMSHFLLTAEQMSERGIIKATNPKNQGWDPF